MIDLVWGVLFLVIAAGIIIEYRSDMPMALLLAGFVSAAIALVFLSTWFMKEVWK